MPDNSSAMSQRGHAGDGLVEGLNPQAEPPPGVDTKAQAEAAIGDSPSSADTTGALIDLIETRYHAAHRRQLSEMIDLARQVEEVHRGDTAPPAGLTALLKHMAVVMEGHMQKEERVLFPIMRRYGQARLARPIAGLLADHDEHGALMRELETLTDGFAAPEHACDAWRALYAVGRELAEDLARHIQIENDLLFPRFVTPAE
ncbi:MAG: hemerythrin domain-containing protein [Acetobacteraceae bacterium]|nr:hemerythrin domain-containing protein [Acetobacteraceae bacterium]